MDLMGILALEAAEARRHGVDTAVEALRNHSQQRPSLRLIQGDAITTASADMDADPYGGLES